MGAQPFVIDSEGETPNEAFWNAVEQAWHDYGYAGYTGTVAEKNDFIIINPETDGENTDDWSQNDYETYAWWMVEQDDPRIADKWGPAGCICYGEGEYIFFGWASS